VLHARSHAVKHDDTRANRTSEEEIAGEDRTIRSSRGDNTKFFSKSRLGAHPRARPRPPAPPVLASGEPDRDTGSTDGDGRLSPEPSPDTDAGLARHASGGPLPDSRHYNTDSADTPAETAVRTPSTGKDVAEDAGSWGLDPHKTMGLELPRISEDAEVGPREVLAPERSSRPVEVPLLWAAFFKELADAVPPVHYASKLSPYYRTARQASNPAPETLSAINPHTSSEPTPPREPRKPSSNNDQLAPTVPRKWFPLSPPPTNQRDTTRNRGDHHARHGLRAK